MTDENLKILNYNQLWLDYRILTEDILNNQVVEFKTSGDENSEHFRYRTFNDYLLGLNLISDKQILQLFDLIKIDPDESIAIAMGLDILKIKNLSNAQFQLVSDNLVKIFGEDIEKQIAKENVWRQKREKN